MAADSPNRVRLKGRDDFRSEGVAAGTITPGDLIEVSGESSGASPEPEVQRSSTAAEGTPLKAFAVEFSATGMGPDDDYSSGDSLYYFVGLPGDQFYAFHNTAEDISYGARLVSAGDGTLRAIDTAGGDTTDAVVAEARSAVTNSSSTSKSRVVVEVV